MGGLHAAMSTEPAPDVVAPPVVFLDRELAVVFASRSARQCRALWAQDAAAAESGSFPPLRLPAEVFRACMRLAAAPPAQAGGPRAGQVVTVSSPLTGLTAIVEVCSSCAGGDAPIGFLVHFFPQAASTVGEAGEVGKPLGSLSPSEEQVARRVAMGRSNRAVARELGKSERTVECQLSAIYRKLGVANRVQLCRALLAAGNSSRTA
jgi:DNA-binding CsgD family transcriptional regulator